MKTYETFLLVQAQYPDWCARLEDANLDSRHADMEEAHRLADCAPSSEAHSLVWEFIELQIKRMMGWPV